MRWRPRHSQRTPGDLAALWLRCAATWWDGVPFSTLPSTPDVFHVRRSPGSSVRLHGIFASLCAKMHRRLLLLLAAVALVACATPRAAALFLDAEEGSQRLARAPELKQVSHGSQHVHIPSLVPREPRLVRVACRAEPVLAGVCAGWSARDLGPSSRVLGRSVLPGEHRRAPPRPAHRECCKAG